MYYDKLMEMPLAQLLEYYNALNSVCGRYEFEIKPYFNSQNQNEQLKWREINDKLVKAKSYRNMVLDIMQDKSFNELDNYEPIKEETKKLHTKK